MQNRLQFRHDTHLYGSKQEILDTLETLRYKGKYSLYAEPLVFRYGTDDNINVVLAIGSKGGQNTNDSSYFVIDTGEIEKSLNDLKKAIGSNDEIGSRLQELLDDISTTLDKNVVKTEKISSDLESVKEEIITKIGQDDLRFVTRFNNLYLLGKDNIILATINTDEWTKDGYIKDISLSSDRQSIEVIWNADSGSKTKNISLRNLYVGTNSNNFLRIDNYENKIDALIGSRNTNGLVTSKMLYDSIEDVYNAIECLSKAIGTEPGEEGIDLSPITELIKYVDQNKIDIENLSDAFDKIKIEIEGINSDITDLKTRVNEHDKLLADIKETDEKQNERLDEQEEVIKEIIDDVDGLKRGFEGIQSSLEEYKSELETVNDKIGDLNELSTDNKDNIVSAINEVNSKVDIALENTNDLNEFVENTKERLDIIQNTIANAEKVKYIELNLEPYKDSHGDVVDDVWMYDLNDDIELDEDLDYRVLWYKLVNESYTIAYKFTIEDKEYITFANGAEYIDDGIVGQIQYVDDNNIITEYHLTHQENNNVYVKRITINPNGGEDSIYNTEINDDTKSVIGDVFAKDLKNKDISTVLDMVLFPLSYPKAPTKPSLEINLPSVPNISIVGSKINIGSVTASLVSGKFNADFKQPTPVYTSELYTLGYESLVEGYSPNKTDNEIESVNNLIVGLGNNTIKYSGVTRYSAPTNSPVDSHGSVCTKTGKDAPEGTATWTSGETEVSKNLVFKGVYPCYSNISNDDTVLTNEPNREYVTDGKTFTFNIVPSEVVSGNVFCFLYPTGRSVSMKTKDIGGNWVDFSSSNYKIEENIDVTVNGETYKYNKLSTYGGTGTMSYIINLSKNMTE